MSQNYMILMALKKGTLTALEALKKFGCMRLASRIYDLRCQGYEILSGKKTLNNGKSIAVYSLKKGKK